MVELREPTSRTIAPVRGWPSASRTVPDTLLCAWAAVVCKGAVPCVAPTVIGTESTAARVLRQSPMRHKRRRLEIDRLAFVIVVELLRQNYFGLVKWCSVVVFFASGFPFLVYYRYTCILKQTEKRRNPG
jgi:hypothetical protein